MQLIIVLVNYNPRLNYEKKTLGDKTYISLNHAYICPLALRKKSLSVASLDPDGVKIEVGDQVLVAGQKQGIVRFYGKTDFAPGMSIVKTITKKGKSRKNLFKMFILNWYSGAGASQIFDRQYLMN